MAFLKNAWYLAAWASEIGDRPLGRMIAGEPIAIFRQESGALAAIGDRCPHRFAPLHLGKVVGDAIECPYHGLHFGGNGHCVLNPHGKGNIPEAAQVPGYPLVERHRGIWIWLGDSDRADPVLIPDYAVMDSTPVSAIVENHLEANANYQLLTDNILDLTHADYLHAGSLGNGSVTQTMPSVREADDAVHADWWITGFPAPPALGMHLPEPAAPADHWLEVKWTAPGNMALRVGATPAGQPREAGIDSVSLHIMTPATDTTTHYFFANARNFKIDDPEMTVLFRELIANQFLGEDKPMIEAQQKMMGTTDLFSLKPVLLPQDVAAVRVRRKLESLIKKEQEEKHATT